MSRRKREIIKHESGCEVEVRLRPYVGHESKPFMVVSVWLLDPQHERIDGLRVEVPRSRWAKMVEELGRDAAIQKVISDGLHARADDLRSAAQDPRLRTSPRFAAIQAVVGLLNLWHSKEFDAPRRKKR